METIKTLAKTLLEMFLSCVIFLGGFAMIIGFFTTISWAVNSFGGTPDDAWGISWLSIFLIAIYHVVYAIRKEAKSVPPTNR